MKREINKNKSFIQNDTSVFDKIAFCIKSTKECTKALMKLSYKNYCNNDIQIQKISNRVKINNNY